MDNNIFVCIFRRKSSSAVNYSVTNDLYGSPFNFDTMEQQGSASSIQNGALGPPVDNDHSAIPIDKGFPSCFGEDDACPMSENDTRVLLSQSNDYAVPSEMIMLPAHPQDDGYATPTVVSPIPQDQGYEVPSHIVQNGGLVVNMPHAPAPTNSCIESDPQYVNSSLENKYEDVPSYPAVHLPNPRGSEQQCDEFPLIYEEIKDRRDVDDEGRIGQTYDQRDDAGEIDQDHKQPEYVPFDQVVLEEPLYAEIPEKNKKTVVIED